MTCSSGTTPLDAGNGTQRGRLSGTLMRTKRTCVSLSLGSKAARLSASIADERERMLGIDGERREDRQHRLAEVLPEAFPLRFVHDVVVDDRDPLGSQRRQNLFAHHGGERLELPQQLVATGFELLLRGAPVERELGGLAPHSTLQTAHPLHEELVVEHAHDAGELDALEQRQLRVLDLRQHAAREGQPAALSIEESRRRVDRNR